MFAAAALQGSISSPNTELSGAKSIEHAAKFLSNTCCVFADAMMAAIAEREQERD